MKAKIPKRLFQLSNAFQASALVPRKIRKMILEMEGISVGSRSPISHHCHLGPNLTIGNDCYINVQCLIETGGTVRIGNGVHLAMRVTILSTSHEIGPPDHRCAEYKRSAVLVGDGAWLGASVTILPGVVIGPGCVIAAGAVVTESTDPHSLYGGVPARKLKDL